ncbi:MAG: permease [Planctomycetes bacterium]|nr:permease [Planctomycetota bacterium]
MDLSGLALSLLALCVGPVLYRYATKGALLLAFLDGFILIAICGLVLLDILPGSYRSAGWWILAPAVIGLFLPAILERMRHRIAAGAHAAALLFGILCLAAHSFLDGVALVPVAGAGAFGGLTNAIILHNLPVGLTVWALLVPSYGAPLAASCLAAMAAFSAAGFFTGSAALAALQSHGIGLFEAFLGGSLLHVVFHAPARTETPQSERSHRLAAGLGAGAALLLGAAVGGHTHAAHEPHAAGAHAAFADEFLHLAAESAPALLIAFTVAGLAFAFLPRASVAWIRKGSTLSQALRGLIFGLPLSVCSCGVIPIYRGLFLQGVPIAAAATFLVSAPELGFDAVFLTARFFGAEFALLRIAGASLLALLIGVWIARLAGGDSSAEQRAAASTPAPRGNFFARIRQAAAMGFVEMVDNTGPWILLGLILATICHPLLDSNPFADYAALEVPLFALLGLPMYVCASGATPLMAVFVDRGVSLGAALAFLLTGPATNVTTFGVLSRLHGRRIALAFGAGMALLATALGYAVNGLPIEVAIAPLAEVHEPGGFATACLWTLAGLFAISLLRQGPRRFLGQVISSPAEEPHAHPHPHPHSHAHAHAHPESHPHSAAPAAGVAPGPRVSRPGGGESRGAD